MTPADDSESDWVCDWPTPHPEHNWETADESGTPYDEWCGGGQ